MSNILKRAILLLLAVTFISSVTIFTFSHRGVFNTHAAAPSSNPNVPYISTLSIYFGSDNDNLYALDAPHGFLRWSYAYAPGGDIWSPVIVMSGVLYFEVSNSTSAAVVSLRSDSSIRWMFQFPLQTYGKSAVTVANGIIYFAVDSNTGTSNIYALNAKDGSKVWTSSATSGDTFGNPIVVNNLIYVVQQPLISGGTSQLVALHVSDGSIAWTTDLAAQAKTNLSAANGAIYFGDTAGSLKAYNQLTGNLLWSSQVNGGPVSTPTATTGTIYYAAANNSVTAVHASDGTLLWNYSVGNKPFSPTVSPEFYIDSLNNGVIFIGSMNLNMYSLNASTGILRWKTKIGTPITTTSISKNGIVHVGLQNGSLRTLNVTDGKQRWYYHSNGTIYTSSPPAEG